MPKSIWCNCSDCKYAIPTYEDDKYLCRAPDDLIIKLDKKGYPVCQNYKLDEGEDAE